MGSSRIPSKLYVTEWQDPTYIGFDMSFDFLGQTDIQNQDYESVSQCLLMDPKEIGSAVQYLYSINEMQRSLYLAKFIEVLRTMNFYAPWHFQSITGLDKLFKIDPEKNWRTGEDAVITIDMLEGFDMKTTMLLDLYRKTAWDSMYHRWMLPENMRQFKVNITLIDYRDMHKTKSLVVVDPSLNAKPAMFKDYQETPDDVSKGKNWAKDTMSAAEETVKNAVRQTITNLTNQVMGDSDTVSISVGDYPSLTLELDLCEFLIIQNSPPYATNLTNADAPTVATQQLQFKVGRVRESSSYDILGIKLNDKDMRTLMTAKDGYTDKENPNAILLGLESRIKKKAELMLNGLMLGNAYGFSLTDIAGSIANAATKNLKSNLQIEKSANLTSNYTQHIINPGANEGLYAIEGANQLAADVDIGQKTKNAGLEGKNITLENTVPHKPKVEENADLQFTEVTKRKFEDNIGLEGPKPKQESLGNVGFSGPPSV
jgi:hypothetical protein